MGALGKLLDYVAPFWRNYGKVIGVDVQDFLIIPWYRNEFTGEPKRYPITVLPRRSFRHWLGLVAFFVVTLAIMFLEGGAAFTFCSWFRLSFIKNSGLWWTTMPIYCLTTLILLCAVLVEAFIVLIEFAVVVWWIAWWARIVD